MSSKIRVLHLAKFYSPVHGGMERILQLLCESTSDEVENHVLAANTSSHTVHELVGQVRVTRIGCAAKIGSVAVCPSLPLWVRRARADLTVLHEPNATALVADALAPSPRPLIVWYHADLVRPAWVYETVYRRLLNRVLHQASCIITSSPTLLDRAAGLRDVRDRCVVVPYGIDAELLARPAPATDWLRAFRARHPGPMALMVGRMVRYKGVDVCLRALVDTGISALIVGDGPQLDGYRTLAAALGLGDRVLFTGAVSDAELRAAYQSCDFLVLPSITRQEAFGVVQLEAMACGKPVISTNLPTGVPWVNRDTLTGLIVAPGDVHALRAALIELARDPALRHRLGIAGRQRVLSEYTLEKTKRRTLALYHHVLGADRIAEHSTSRAWPHAAAGGASDLVT